MKETFVRFHSPISLSEYCLINTPAYGYAVPELREFYQQPNLPIWGLFVSEYIFLQKNRRICNYLRIKRLFGLHGNWVTR